MRHNWKETIKFTEICFKMYEKCKKIPLPAVWIALKHDFWSILGHMTYLADGRSWRNVNKHRVKVIPVAMGTTNAPAVDLTPGRKGKIALKYTMLYTHI